MIDIIAGTRPNFVKIAPIIRAIQARGSKGSFTYRLVHTGQHYDNSMSGNFFRQLGIPDPDVNLNVLSGSQAEQTAAIMVEYEKLLLTSKCDLCLVVGDVNSTMACAITAQKLQIPVAHVEAGIRSGDWTMPEEINRLITDSISNYFFTTSSFANENLKKMGVKEESIFFVGNVMIDSLFFNQHAFSRPDIWEVLELSANDYFVLTLHRPSNVDDKQKLKRLLDEIGLAARGSNVIFPVHPRVTHSVTNFVNLPTNIKLVQPQAYLQFGYLLKNARAVITDSGGVTEECTMNGVPCMTLRDSTERPETITLGTNELLGCDLNAIKPAFDRVFQGQWKEGSFPDMWDGKSSERIVAILEEIIGT